MHLSLNNQNLRFKRPTTTLLKILYSNSTSRISSFKYYITQPAHSRSNRIAITIRNIY